MPSERVKLVAGSLLSLFRINLMTLTRQSDAFIHMKVTFKASPIILMQNTKPHGLCVDAKNLHVGYVHKNIWRGARSSFVYFYWELIVAPDLAHLHVCKSIRENLLFSHSFGNEYVAKDPPK
jgi:hypothetical protein